MLKGVMFKGLFKRMIAKGVHPIIAGELASANYPSKKNQPQKPPVIPTAEVNQVTEQFLDFGSVDARELWHKVWGMSPDDYFGIDLSS